MRTQGYDRTANMSGIHRGVLAMIRERIPTTQYLHCKAHVLNYCTFVIRCISKYHDANVQEISISFHYASTLATSKALEYLQTNGDGKSGVHLSALLPI